MILQKATGTKTEAEAKEVRKVLFAQLKADGFKKVKTDSKTLAGTKMGRSSAYTGSTKKSETHFIHQDGRKALVKMNLNQYRNSSLAVYSD